MSGHTPGPWAVSPDHIFRNQGDIFEIHWSDIGECIAECVHGKENARLIAAAPELLEALIGLLADITEYQTLNNLGGEDNHWQAIASAAIAKATGEAT